VYQSDGIYVVQISGRSSSFILGSGASTTSNKRKLVRCLSLGDIGATNLINAFTNCVNLIECPTSLPAGTFMLQGFFQGCASFNHPNVCKWDTSTVTNMAQVFNNATAFNQPIGSWNTSLATTMQGMFTGAPSFNQPLGNWDTSRVTNFGGIFNGATSFNQQIGGWDTSSATRMSGAFSSALAFQQTLAGWNVSNVYLIFQMFVNSRYAQDVSAWDIRKSVSLASTFPATWGNANYSAALIAWAALPDSDLRVQSITAFAAQGANTRVSAADHGMVTGSRVNISGTTNYNGNYDVLANTVGSFDIATPFVANDATGTMRHLRSRNVPLGVGTLKYSAAAANARAQLINDYGWVITDGGQE
jgi:surface protein